jgi:ribonuclease Y
MEVAHLAGLMAGELGVDVSLAKRAGLLHDIGKALNYEIEGTHVKIGADIAVKYKEGSQVVNAILAHHGDVEPTSIIAILVQAADSISASRPGARREALESYIKRLEKLEKIVNSFVGVEKCFAIQAGREVRIIVENQIISEEKAEVMAREIAVKIESELKYPGIVKVTVIRETRVIDYAR